MGRSGTRGEGKQKRRERMGEEWVRERMNLLCVPFQISA